MYDMGYVKVTFDCDGMKLEARTWYENDHREYVGGGWDFTKSWSWSETVNWSRLDALTTADAALRAEGLVRRTHWIAEGAFSWVADIEIAVLVGH